MVYLDLLVLYSLKDSLYLPLPCVDLKLALNSCSFVTNFSFQSFIKHLWIKARCSCLNTWVMVRRIFFSAFKGWYFGVGFKGCGEWGCVSKDVSWVVFSKKLAVTGGGSLQSVCWIGRSLLKTAVRGAIFYIVVRGTAVLVNLCHVDLVSEHPEMWLRFLSSNNTSDSCSVTSFCICEKKAVT